MALKFRYVLFFLALFSMASVGTFAWAGHGGHGGGHGGHGWGGGHGGVNWHGGHGYFYGNNYFAGWGRGYGWGHGYSNRFYGGYLPYLASNYVYGWPYRSYYSYYRPYATYSYPSYSYPYYSDDCDCNYTVTESAPQYVASATVEERLPEPAVNLSVEGQPTSPTGTIHQLSSLVLNAPEPAVPTPQTEHHDGDRLVTDERMDAKAHSLLISEVKQPQEMARSRSMPQPTSGAYASVTAAELRDWLRLR